MSVMSDTDLKLHDLGRRTYDAIKASVDQLNLDYDQLDELREARTPWAVGYNMPGYMPDNEPACFGTWKNARDYLVSELESTRDRVSEAEEILLSESEREEWLTGKLQAAIDELKRLSDGTEFGRTIGIYYYWLDRAHNDGLTDDEFDEYNELTRRANGCESRDKAYDNIQFDVLSVLVRTDWHEQSAKKSDISRQYQLLLGTGGPAMRIVGNIDCYGQAETATLEVQDWFTPWTAYLAADESVLLEFAQCFSFEEI